MVDTVVQAVRSVRARNGRGALNLVSLAALQAELGLDAQAYAVALREARVTGRVVLHSHDGRHGSLTAQEAAAVVVEQGRRFAYAAVRGD